MNRHSAMLSRPAWPRKRQETAGSWLIVSSNWATWRWLKISLPWRRNTIRPAMLFGRKFADREGMALALNRLGTVSFRQQAYAEARSLFLQSLDLYRELNDKGGLASTINGLGFVACGQADYGTAAQHFQQALHIVRELRFTPLALWVLLGSGECC